MQLAAARWGRRAGPVCHQPGAWPCARAGPALACLLMLLACACEAAAGAGDLPRRGGRACGILAGPASKVGVTGASGHAYATPGDPPPGLLPCCDTHCEPVHLVVQRGVCGRSFQPSCRCVFLAGGPLARGRLQQRRCTGQPPGVGTCICRGLGFSPHGQHGQHGAALCSSIQSKAARLRAPARPWPLPTPAPTSTRLRPAPSLPAGALAAAADAS